MPPCAHASATQPDRSPKLSKILEILIILRSQLLCVLAVPNVLFRVDIKALRVSWKPDRWDNGSSVFAMEHSIPVNAAEEWVVFYARCAALYVAEPP